jgi:coenzyme PQQ synthesis protein D (PqqD)
VLLAFFGDKLFLVRGEISISSMVSTVVYRPAPDLVVRKVGEESVIVPVRSRVADLDAVVTLNRVASRVWELLDGQRSVDAIAEAICDEFEVPPETARADVDELIGNLAEGQLIEPVEGIR